MRLPSAILPGFATLLVMGAIEPRLARSQNLTVQQPVFESTSVGTTVSVPDRGGASLGGVGRAADSRTSFGPLRSRTNSGQSRSAGGMSVHATIHDFEEMDQQALNRATARSQSGSAVRGEDPYALLLARTQRRGQGLAAPGRGPAGMATSSRTTESAPVASTFAPREELPPAPVSKTAADGGETSFRLGKLAEDRGAMSVARLHYRTAAKHGHAEAQTRLEALTGHAASSAE